MKLDAEVNNRKNLPCCMDDKKITSQNPSFIERVNFISRLNTEGYKEVNFAIKTCEFYNREQPELNQLPYSQPVEKIVLPYKYHEKTTLTQECQEHCLLLHAPPILNDSTTIKNDSFINTKQDNSLMLVNKTNIPEVKSTNNFRLNRSANKFSNFIFEIKSIQEKSTRYLKNKFKKNNNEELCVTFERGKAKITDNATIARKNLMKQHEKANDAKTTSDIIYTIQQEKSDLYNEYKILLNEISLVESKANKLIIKDKNTKNNVLFQCYSQFKQLNIIDILDLPRSSFEKYKKIENIFNQMKSTIRRLENYINESTINKQLTWDDNDLNWNNPLNQSENIQITEFVKHNYSQETMNDTIRIINNSDSDIISEDAKIVLNEFFNDNHQNSNINFYSSNESINSTSSGYYSEFTDDSEYSSKESTYKKIIINDVTQNNDELKNKNLENIEKAHKKTHNSVKQKEKKYQCNGEIHQTITSMLRAKYNSNKYQFSLNENSPEIISNHGKINIKKLDAILEKAQITIRDINNLGKEIATEEARSAKIKKQLISLEVK